MSTPQSTNVIAKYSTQIPQYDEGNKMALLTTSGDQLIGPSFEDLIWKYVAIGSNSINNNTTDFPKSPGNLLIEIAVATVLPLLPKLPQTKSLYVPTLLLVEKIISLPMILLAMVINSMVLLLKLG